MKIYFGTKQPLKLVLGGVTAKIEIPTLTQSGGINLLSSDGYKLQDKNGLYLTSKESE